MGNWYKRTILPRLVNAQMGGEELVPIRRQTVKAASGVVLEVGVGAGHNLLLYKSVTKLYALEPSVELIALAKPRANSLLFPVKFLVAPAERIPLPDGAVDAVVSTWTLCSVRDPHAALGEIKRVLKPGGLFFFVEHGVAPTALTHLSQSAYTALMKRFTGNCHHDRDFDALFVDAGFAIKKMERSWEEGRPLIYNYEGVALA